MAFHDYKVAMLREFCRDTRITPRTKGGVVIEIPCTGGHFVSEEFDMRMPPDKARKHLISKGWQIAARRATCPQHMHKDKPMSEPKVEQPERSDAAKRARRMIYMALEDYYDESQKRYKAGWSDQRIADETGASVQFVASIREDDFGPSGEPPEIAEFRERLAKFEEDAQRIIAADALATKRIADNLDNLKNDLAGLKVELARLVRLNGW